RLADRLRRDHAYGLAQFHQASGGEVASVATDADAALGFAGQHRTNLHALNAGRLNRRSQLFIDVLVDIDDDVALIVLDLLERGAADDAVAQRLDDVAGFNDGADIDAIERSAVVLADDHVLRNVNQAARQVAGVGGLERRIRQAFARAMRRDEVLQ